MRSQIRARLLAFSLAIVPVLAGAQPSPVGPEFQANTYTTSGQYNATVSADALGNFVVVWDSYNQDGDADGVFGQRYTSAGTRVGGEFQANTFTTSSYTGRFALHNAACNGVSPVSDDRWFTSALFSMRNWHNCQCP